LSLSGFVFRFLIRSWASGVFVISGLCSNSPLQLSVMLYFLFLQLSVMLYLL